jgi:probable HAF family extracellular repeat protein
VLERGKVTRIDVPEARLTVPHGINDRGQVVGEYTDANGMDRGFLWTRGRVTTFAVADATFTKPNAINDRGRIVGVYENPNYQSPTATPRPQLGLLWISGRQRGGCSG